MTDSMTIAPRLPRADANLHGARLPVVATPQNGPTRNRRRVLVCDDKSQSLRALRVVLRSAGFDVTVTRTATEALDRCALRVPDAAIIELELPDADGVDVCRGLRRWSTIPLIVLSAIDDEKQQVRALDAGADDFVTKPFRPGELVARLRANVRRAAPQDAHGRVALEGLEIDLAAGVVCRAGQEVHLTPIEIRLLEAFLSNRGRLLTHETLLLQVWGAAYIEDKRTLRAHIANLRRKIDRRGQQSLIDTHPRIGYRFADSYAPSASAEARLATGAVGHWSSSTPTIGRPASVPTRTS